MLYFEVVGHRVPKDGNGGGMESEVWRRKIKVRDREKAMEKAKKWMKRNILNARMSDYTIEVRPVPIREPRPVIPIRRPPVSRISRDGMWG